MRPSFLVPLAIAVSVLATKKTAPSPPSDPAETLKKLRDAATFGGRIKAVKSEDWMFDFNTVKPVEGEGGKLFAANVANFPTLDTLGLALTVGKLGGCGMNTPHYHPRASEILYNMNGTHTSNIQNDMNGKLLGAFVQENGVDAVMNTFDGNKAMIFPTGSIHFQTNLGCDEVTFLAALSDEDPGTGQVAQIFFQKLPQDVVEATLGAELPGVVMLKDLKIPDNVALGIDECRKTCGLPRLSDNYANGNYANSKAKSSADTKPQAQNQSRAVFGAVAEDASTIAAAGGISSTVLIALCVVVGAMALGYVAIGVYFLVDRRRRRRSQQHAARWFVQTDTAGRSLVPTDEKYDTAP